MIILVMVTIPKEKAQEMARFLVTERVCACVNIIEGVKSIFWWKDKVDESDEAMLLIKTRDILYAKLQTMIKNNHPYENPEIIAISIDQISPEYLKWVNASANTQPYT
jgi:periplasmic divalent cation tolerance protein